MPIMRVSDTLYPQGWRQAASRYQGKFPQSNPQTGAQQTPITEVKHAGSKMSKWTDVADVMTAYNAADDSPQMFRNPRRRANVLIESLPWLTDRPNPIDGFMRIGLAHKGNDSRRGQQLGNHEEIHRPARNKACLKLRHQSSG